MEQLRDPWNLIDIFVVVFGFFTVVMEWCLSVGYEIDGTQSLNLRIIRFCYAFLTLLIMAKAFFYCRGYANLGFLINMILNIIKDMANFTIVLVIAGLGFAMCNYQLQARGEDQQFGGPVDSMFFTYNALVGNVEEYTSFLGDWSRLIYVVYTAFTVVVMLNLLIAIMGDTFDRIQEGYIKAKNIERLGLLREYISMHKDEVKDAKKLGEAFDPYIYIFREQSCGDIDDDSAWLGKVKSLSNKIKNVLNETKTSKSETRQAIEDMKTRLNSILGGEIRTVKKSVGSDLKSLETQIRALKQQQEENRNKLSLQTTVDPSLSAKIDVMENGLQSMRVDMDKIHQTLEQLASIMLSPACPR